MNSCHHVRRFTTFRAVSLALTPLVMQPGWAQTASVPVITLNGTAAGRTFDGLGAVSGGGNTSRLLPDYPDAQRRQILDYLFKPRFGAALSELKIEVGGDVNSTEGSEPSHMHVPGDENYNRGFEWWLMRQARARNPQIALDCVAWGAPGWIGNGNFWSPDMQDYYIKFLQGAKRVHNLDFVSVGGKNESGYRKDWYIAFRKSLDDNGLSKVKLVASDDWGPPWLNIANDAVREPALARAIDAFGGHVTWPENPAVASPAVLNLGKPLWDTEMHNYVPGTQEGLRGFAAEIGLVNAFNTNYIKTKITQTIVWNLIWAYYPVSSYPDVGMMRANSPWSGHYEVLPVVWGYAHINQFVKPGWRFLDGGGCGVLPGGGTYTTMKAPKSGDYSVIVETQGAKSPQTVRFAVGGGLSQGNARVWKSAADNQFVQAQDAQIHEGAFVLTLAPDTVYTITTTRGQHKGEYPASPADAPLRLPYRDDYQNYPLAAQARYHFDYHGAFEIAPKTEGAGKCLRQAATQSKSGWGGAYLPLTFLGSDTWQDYALGVNAYIEHAGAVSLHGRIGNIPGGNNDDPPGYTFRVHDDGAYEVKRFKTVIAQGRTPFAADRWHTLRLDFKGARIAGFVDNAPVFALEDTLYRSGLAGLGTGWNFAQFSDLVIEPLAAPAPTAALATPAALTTQAALTIQTDAAGHKISPDLYGIFFEEINRAGDGGLYAEMLQNRSFEDSARPLGWAAVTTQGAEAAISLDKSRPLNTSNPTSLRVEIKSGGIGFAGVASQGFKGIPSPGKTYPDHLRELNGAWLARYDAATKAADNGLAVRQGAKYNFSLYARAAPGFSGPLTVSLEAQNGTVLTSQQIAGLDDDWRQFHAVLTSSTSDLNARLVISATQSATVWLDMVSLFPSDTFKGRPNGLRLDLAQMLVALHPAFLRFPGGSYAEGNLLADSYKWKQTIGPVAERPGHWNIWGYRSSDGLGYHEYLQMCEDLGAKPLFVVNCGMAEADFAPVDQIGSYVQDALDAIEYANGPVSSHWGAIRAYNGHAKPFGLTYVEIGNENGLSYPWGGGSPQQYLERYRPFYDAIQTAYPNIKIISNIDLPAPKDIVDEHYYDTAAWFAGQAARYDGMDRKGPQIYVGEYAVTKNAGGGNLNAALGEAAFMTGLERNGDIVRMASYAPLFVNPRWSRWGPDAIVFDSARAYGTPSYYVQAMFASARPDVTLPLKLEGAKDTPPTLFAVAGRKTDTGELIVKVVNMAGTACDVAMDLRGAAQLAPLGSATVLCSTDPKDENSFEAPTRIAPQTQTFAIAAPTFHYMFAPYSVTVLRLPTR